MISDLILQEKSYDTLPNFTGKDILVLKNFYFFFYF
jgi:hypothetical protein